MVRDSAQLTICTRGILPCRTGYRWRVATAVFFVLELLIVLGCSTRVGAQQLCTGYDTERATWGLTSVDFTDTEVANCPSGNAFMAHTLIPRAKFFQASCCPLPDGSLTDKQLFAEKKCPTNFIATGMRWRKLIGGTQKEGKVRELRCTAVATETYELVAAETLEVMRIRETSGGVGSTDMLTTTRGRVPPYLRYGLGRDGKYSWFDAYCAGFPWGSVLSGYGERACEGTEFFTLRKRNASAMPADTCRAVANVFSIDAKCISDLDFKNLPKK